MAEQAQNCSPAPKWAAQVDDQPIPMPRQLVKVAVIKAQAEIPPGFVLVRDYDSPDDVVLGDEETVDLAQGNVFYRLAVCDAKPRVDCKTPPKLAFFVDDRPEVTIRAIQSGKTIRELFGFNDDVNLYRDYESPHDEPIGLEEAAPFDKGPVFYTRRQHTQLKIIVNNKPFTEAEGVKHQMTGLQIATLVSETPRNTEVFKLLKNGGQEAVPLDKEICIKDCDQFRVIRNNVAGGFTEPTRIERELDKLKQGGCRADFIQQPFPAVVYRDVPTRPGYAHLPMTDVLVIVPGGYGESIGDDYHAFDLLEHNGENLRPLPYRIRLVRLVNLLLSELPRYLEPAEVERILNSCDRRSGVGKRNYAIFLLLARLGLRAGEVVKLKLDDIDWNAGEVCIQGKGARIDRLPLLQDLRHRFAIQTLLNWYRTDVDVGVCLPELATYLGHVHVNDTYWYLSATPELLQLATLRWQRAAGGFAI